MWSDFQGCRNFDSAICLGVLPVRDHAGQYAVLGFGVVSYTGAISEQELATESFFEVVARLDAGQGSEGFLERNQDALSGFQNWLARQERRWISFQIDPDAPVAVAIPVMRIIKERGLPFELSTPFEWRKLAGYLEGTCEMPR